MEIENFIDYDYEHRPAVAGLSTSTGIGEKIPVGTVCLSVGGVSVRAL